MCFFFQAEDGIRRMGGTGVQTCALPTCVTVTGQTPVVDVQSARQSTVLDGDVVRALPASRSYGNYLAAIPAVQEIGRATCREREQVSVVAVSLKKIANRERTAKDA